MKFTFLRHLTHICSLVLPFIPISFINTDARAATRPEAKEIVAIQLRAQGIPCTNPEKAIKDEKYSSRDEMAWLLVCKEAVYRVKLIPHVGAEVEVVDPDDTADGDTQSKK